MGKTYFEQVPLEVAKRIAATELREARGATPCTICGYKVRFEDSKTDERGRPVHENCYVTSRILQGKSRHA